MADPAKQAAGELTRQSSEDWKPSLRRGDEGEMATWP
jgi:hypothetical protein